ncbi:sigma-70-like protein [Azospirillum brasilense]|uniref:Sigma-70-like protein n=1 Tax=Azospirillum brasilense TaxID=192 RepID=A0A560B3Q4_AZOBR|nr:RNA polymerase sigma factor region1.1 domain-containing protein [Azospirillum brasilense]TWA67260.1 sigma-70-like protein [Azospirillum brasilense]
MTIDDATLQRLIDKGRKHGNRLGIEQLGQDVPVETMTPEEVAVVVERLEAAGIDVELTDERLKRPRGGGDYERGAGVVTIASPAAPAVSAPGARPSVHGWADEGVGHAHGGHHGSRRAPTWDRDGVDMLPIVSVLVVALVLIFALGG